MIICQVPFQNLEKEFVAPAEEEEIGDGEKMFRTILEDGIAEEEEEEEINNNNNNDNQDDDSKMETINESMPLMKETVADSNLVPSPLQQIKITDSRSDFTLILLISL